MNTCAKRSGSRIHAQIPANSNEKSVALCTKNAGPGRHYILGLGVFAREMNKKGVKKGEKNNFRRRLPIILKSGATI